MLTDLEIAHSVKMKPVSEIAEKLAIPQEALNFYGNNIAKINRDYLKTLADKPDGKLILVTATTPTPAGEGKTTVTVGLGQALALRNKRPWCAFVSLLWGRVLVLRVALLVVVIAKWYQWSR